MVLKHSFSFVFVCKKTTFSATERLLRVSTAAEQTARLIWAGGGEDQTYDERETPAVLLLIVVLYSTDRDVDLLLENLQVEENNENDQNNVI